MKLILAQGNPGQRYAATRHNIGFRLVDKFIADKGGEYSTKAKFSTDIAELRHGHEKVIFAKPTTFYNDTGIAARALIDFYKLDPERDVMVLHDELMLPIGKLRIRHSGSDAGNNGIKSLNAHIGARYTRLRIGIWTAHRDRVDDTTFVLGAFSPLENKIISELIEPEAINLIARFIDGSVADETISLDLSAFEQADNEADE